MDPQSRCLRLGAAAITLAMLIKLGSGGFFAPAVHALEQPQVMSFLMYLETGRILKLPSARPETPTAPGESTAPPEIPENTQPTTLPASTEPSAPLQQEALNFSAADVKYVKMRYGCKLRPELSSLLTRPLKWQLRSDQPTVLILHTHATESYTKQKGESYTESSHYRTKNKDYNLVSIGTALAQALEEAGISVIHDTQLHDYPSYNGSYTASRKAVQAYLKKYPSIRLILDLHRDAASDGAGGQIDPQITVDGKNVAQLMLVVGTDAGGLSHPDWQDNLSLALQLSARLEQNTPGLTKPVNLRAERFNQDLSAGMLLVEVGAAGNTHQEALRAAKYLAQAIIDLSCGANMEE